VGVKVNIQLEVIDDLRLEEGEVLGGVEEVGLRLSHDCF